MMATIGTSYAADLPQSEPDFASPAPAEVMQASPWEGAYAGVSMGWLWSETNSNGGAASVDADGFSIGGYGGYNMSYNNVIFGPELLVNYNDLSDRGATTRYESSWDTEVRARAGYDMGFFVPYAAVGVGAQDGTLTSLANGRSDDNVHGFVSATGGVEAMVAQNVSLRAEAGYRWSNHKNYNFGTSSTKTDLDGPVAKVGLSYHF